MSSRNEDILKSIIGGETYNKRPKSRIEELLIQVGDLIKRGGASEEQIKNAINDYLDRHPTNVTREDLNELKEEVAHVDSRLSESIVDISEIYNEHYSFEKVELQKNWGGSYNANRARLLFSANPNAVYTCKINKCPFEKIGIIRLTSENGVIAGTYINPSTTERTVSFTCEDNASFIVIQFEQTNVKSSDFDGFEMSVIDGRTVLTGVDKKARKELENIVNSDEIQSEKIDTILDVVGTYSKVQMNVTNGFYLATGSNPEPTANRDYYCAKIPVVEDETLKVSGSVIARAYGATALIVYIDKANTKIIGYECGEEAEAKVYTDYPIHIPNGCGYIGITSSVKVGGYPVVKRVSYDANVFDASKKYKVTVESDHITVETNTGNVYNWKPLLANNLYQLYSWVIDGKTYEHHTDMVGPFMNLVAVNNGDGNRSTSPSYTNASFTGGCHGFNGDQTGTPTANVISKHIILDGREQGANGVYFCDSLTLKFIDGIQAHNTCKEDGTGRTVLNEEVTYTFEGDRIKVSAFLTPLEDVKVQRYYGLQLAGYKNYYMLADKYYEIGNTGRKQVKPTIIVGYDDNSQVSVKMYETGLGDYHYNQTQDKAISSSDKAYFYPIEVSGGQLWSQGETWYWIGEYVFGKVFDFA